MYLFLSFCVGLAGFYLLYNTSARVVFARRKFNFWLFKHHYVSTTTGSLMVLTSWLLMMLELGIGVGSFFALISLMVISSLTIILLPLKKSIKP